uniref:Uncharacterized protein LOC102810406 n=1 Tax=Saccoglossus kowalevskii TaxID=10224 RepID=A0ABM0MUR6_SACKO|nr:PREDICTED: uncharacterized protein LOC102810406 [Saccoglossus kowalevskii]
MAFHIVCYSITAVQQLLAAGVSANVRDGAKSLNTPLHWAASYANIEMLKFLLDNKASVNVSNSDGATPLHDAVQRGDVDIVDILVKNKANCHAKANKGTFAGKTPLDCAIDKKEIYQILSSVPVVLNNLPNGLTNGNDSTEYDSDDVLLYTANTVEDISTKPDSRILDSPVPSYSSEVIGTPSETPLTVSTDNVIDKLNEMLSSSNLRQSAPSLVTDARLHLLWPQPQRIVQRQGPPFHPQQLLNIHIGSGPDKGPSLCKLLLLSNFLIGDNVGGLSLQTKYALLGIQNHHTVLLCANIFHEREDILPQFPLGTVLMECGYKADYDFEKFGKVLSENGELLDLDTYCQRRYITVVPYIDVQEDGALKPVQMTIIQHIISQFPSSDIGGCPEASVRNIFNSIMCAQSHGALGLVLTDWAGIGCLNHQPFSWPGYITAAGLSWNHASRLDFIHSNLPDLINKHVYMDHSSVIGQVIIEVGRAETYLIRASKGYTGTECGNLPPDEGSLLYQILTSADDVSIEKLTPESIQKALLHARRCQNVLSKAVKTTHNSLLLSELQVTTDLLLLTSKVGKALVLSGLNPNKSGAGYPVINVGLSNLSATSRTDIANKLLGISEQYRQTWLGSNLPNGLKESLMMLHRTLKQLIPESKKDWEY